MSASTSLFSKPPFHLLLLCGVLGMPAGAEPFVPRDDAVVLEHVPSKRDPAALELRELRRQLSRDTTNLTVASDLARRYIALGRAEGDPRYLGRAQSVLAPWWEAAQAPVEALVLRATLKQSQHDFPAALHDLNTALQLAPANAQAWLTRATVLTVQGEYRQARSSCLALARLAPELVVVTASGTIAALTGQAERSCSVIQGALERASSASPAEKLWALTVCAETYARLDHARNAEALFQQALVLGERDSYLLGAYADFLLDQHRAGEVINLLRNETRVDALLLRLALAEQAVPSAPSCLSEHVQKLGDRFEEAHRRGDSVHRREEARFALHVLHEPARALGLAKANWEVQREPPDLRILLEAALAASAPLAAQSAVQFAQTNRLEDARVGLLCAQLAGTEAK